MKPKPIDRTKYLDESEVRQLRESAKTYALADLQRKRSGGPIRWMLVDLALSTGLRVGEMRLLRRGDVQLRRSMLTVRRLKKRQTPPPESLAISDALKAHLREYLDWQVEAGRGSEPTDPLLVGERGQFSVRGLQRLWDQAIELAGVERVSIHGARHTLAVHLLKRTSNLRVVQKQLGHSDPTITANLYADVSFEDMREAVQDLYGPPEAPEASEASTTPNTPKAPKPSASPSPPESKPERKRPREPVTMD